MANHFNYIGLAFPREFDVNVCLPFPPTPHPTPPTPQSPHSRNIKINKLILLIKKKKIV